MRRTNEGCYLASERTGWWRFLGWRLLLVVLLFPGVGFGQQAESGPTLTPMQVVKTMIAHEDDDRAHKDQYEFLSQERSDRTGQHVWTERVAETSFGRVRFLLAIDGKPLDAAAEGAERGRLAEIVADPEAFEARERSQKDDEARARKMLDLLPQAFVFDNVRLEDGVWKMDYRPNAAYDPHGIEDRVLAAMQGTVAIDAAQGRLLHIDGELPADVSIGFGLVATVKAGSTFSSDRADEGGHWRTLDVKTDIKGKAVLFKSVSKSEYVARSEFRYLQPGITIAQAVALVEAPGAAEVAGVEGVGR
ncbi:MAG: hypothetical protein WBY53_03040 [Acidobacteriaceae bacterium]